MQTHSARCAADIQGLGLENGGQAGYQGAGRWNKSRLANTRDSALGERTGIG